MKELTSRVTGTGTLLQSGIPHKRSQQDMGNPRGLMLRGVVVTTYVTDDDAAPVPPEDKAIGVYCDVVVYSGQPSIRYQLLRAVPVVQDRSGLHSGRIWKPRAASFDITGGTLDIEKGTNLANVDGDHVLVGFLDGTHTRPVILGALPHPANDVGNEDKAVGNRMRLKAVDGDPDFWKHHGVFYGVADNGDWVVDTTQANAGELEPNGKEKAPPTDGSGSQFHTLPQDAQYVVTLMDMSNPASPQVVTELAITKALLELVIEAGAALKIEGKDANAKATLGDGAVSMTISEHLETLYGNLKTALETYNPHVHPTAWGPSGPAAPVLVVPPWDPTIKSSKLKTPDL
jgi:hypothetical protein